MIQRQVSAYKILSQVGQGGMSIVYEAIDPRLNRKVALKVLHPYLKQAKEAKERFAREAQIAASLQHPNILQVYDYARDTTKEADELYIVTEFVEGLTLKEFAEKHKLFDLPELGALIIREVALTLQYAHAHEVVHRDVKPENIMVRKDGTLKLMDFGIAQIKQLESLTSPGTLLGSPAHVAPEVIEGKRFNKSADIFSLTTVMYWILTGKLPFSGDSPHALLKAIVDGQSEAAQKLSPKISNQLSQIISKGMQTDPKKRFKSAQDLGKAIDKSLIDQGLKISPSSLKNILAKPDTEVDNFKKFVISKCFEKTEKHKQEKETAKALSLLSRILAEDPNDSKGNRLLTRIYQKPRRRIRFALYGLSGLILTALCWLFLITFSNENLFDVATEVEQKKPVASIEKLEPQLRPTEPLKKTEQPKQKTEKKTKPPKAVTPAGKSSQILTSTLTIKIDPFADIYLNNKLIKPHTSSHQINLKEGIYKLTFRHRFAAAVEKIVKIKPGQKDFALNISLNKTKPALLIIKSNVAADVAVNGVYKGSSAVSHERPILVSIPDRKHSLETEVLISRKGYQPVVVKTRFIAGSKKIIKVSLNKL